MNNMLIKAGEGFNNYKDRTFKLSIVPFIIFFVLCASNVILKTSYERVFLVASILIISMQMFMIINVINIDYVYVFAVIFYCFIATIINGSGFGTIIVFTIIVFSLIISREVSFKHKNMNMLDLSYLIVVGFLLWAFSDKDNIMYKCKFNGFLLNPNGYAIFMISFGMLGHIVIKNIIEKKYLSLIFHCLLAIFVSYQLYRTGARTSFLAYLIYLLLIGVYSFNNSIRKKLDKNPAGIIKIMLVFSFVVFVGYLLLYLIIGDDNYQIMGKSLFSGRELIWLEAVGLYLKNILFGFSNKHIYEWGGYVNTHNGFLSIMCHLTIVGLMVIVVLFVNSVRTKKDSSLDMFKILALAPLIFCNTFENLFDVIVYIVWIPFLLNKRRIEE